MFHPRTNALRVVFDCAVSLNDFIYEGPDLMNPLVNVLMRFRRYQYAVCSDIRKMYLNIRMLPSDRGAFRFLWWPNGDLSLEPVEYRAAVHIFGSKSSGFIANNCVRKLAATASGSVRDVLSNDLYVDDQASSFKCVNEAVSTVTGCRNVLDSANLHLTKFISNSSEILASVPVEDRAECDKVLMSDESSILGINWEIKTDMFTFTCKLPENDVLPTRRNMLSAVARIYDPLGIVSPALLSVRLVLQSKSHLEWDAYDDEMFSVWENFQESVKLINTVKLNRCYNSEFEPQRTELHGFGDASESGYAYVLYLRHVSIDGKISVSFVTGKSRVAPKFKGKISQATIPKLELNASAVLAVLSTKVIKWLDIKVDESYFWCDNESVLKCINATDKRFPVYWSNRLGKIYGNSTPEQWRYVPTDSNPADVGTRAIDSAEFSRKMQFWLNGPQFLLESEEYWPEQPRYSGTNDFTVLCTDVDVLMFISGAETECAAADNFQIRSSAVGAESDSVPACGVGESPHCLMIDNNNDDTLQRLINYYSSLPKLLRVVARVLRFMKNPTAVHRADITADDIESARLAVIRYDQKLKLNVKHIQSLNPVNDQKGVLRVKTRLAKSVNISYDTRFPVILSKGSHLTNVIIRHEHCVSGHASPHQTLCQLRKRYWVINGMNAVKRVSSKCRICIERNARPLEQKMSDLPDERTRPSGPFVYVGLDYFGPFYCVVGRRRFKRYGCVFVCLSTRAVHIEMVNALDTPSFLCSLSRFISRRGPTKEIFSDNATNFTGAQDEVKDVKLLYDADMVNDFCAQNGISWHFHPPLGSHHGGHYERQIRSIRRHLGGLTQEQELSEDNLCTVLCLCEKIINDRPLSSLSSDPNDLTPLTPSTILLLRGNSSSPMFDSDLSPRQFHKQAEYLADIFWARWQKEYVNTLSLRQKWHTQKPNVKVNDLLLMTGEGKKRGQWPLARVLEVFTEADGLVRKVKVKCKGGVRTRPITKLAMLEAA